MIAQTPRARTLRARTIRDNLRTLRFGLRRSITHAISGALAGGEEFTMEDFNEWNVAYQNLRLAEKQIDLLTEKYEAQYTERNREYQASLGG
jgi:hypothetical protein